MTRAICTSCRTTFTRRADQGWKILCLSCWRARANAVAKSSGGLLASTLAENRQLRVQLDYLRGELAAALAKRAPSKTDIPREMLRRLISLCHPDRHGNSVASTKATQWLLQRRGQA